MVKFGDHWTVNGFGETSIDLEGIVIVLNGSQPLAIGILWYRTITQVYTACNFFLLPRRWLFLRAEKIRKNIVEIKKGGKCKRIVTTVPCHNLLWRQDLNMSDLNMPVEHIKWFSKTNNDSIISFIYYWLFIGEKIIMIREVRGIFDICHNMQLTLAQLEMFVQSTANILEHLPLNKRSKVTPGPDLLKYEHWTMPLVFTNEEGWIFRTKFRRRKMLARPSSAFMIILISWKFGWEILTIGQTM